MGVLKQLLENLVNITNKIDREVDKGYDLSNWGDQMKFLHALQVQAQILIDMVLRASSLLGYSPPTPSHAAKYLLEEKIIGEREYSVIRSVIGFRNVIVHEYASIDFEIVSDILENRRYRELVNIGMKLYEILKEQGIDP